MELRSFRFVSCEGGRGPFTAVYRGKVVGKGDREAVTVEKETNSYRFCYVRVGGCGQLVCLGGNGPLLHVGVGPYVQGVEALAEERPLNTQSNKILSLDSLEYTIHRQADTYMNG